MFREIKTREKITDAAVHEEESNGFEAIKPTTDMTLNEARKFIDDLFAI